MIVIGETSWKTLEGADLMKQKIQYKPNFVERNFVSLNLLYNMPGASEDIILYFSDDALIMQNILSFLLL